MGKSEIEKIKLIIEMVNNITKIPEYNIYSANSGYSQNLSNKLLNNKNANPGKVVFDCINTHPELFSVYGLSANKNTNGVEYKNFPVWF